MDAQARTIPALDAGVGNIKGKLRATDNFNGRQKVAALSSLAKTRILRFQ